MTVQFDFKMFRLSLSATILVLFGACTFKLEPRKPVTGLLPAHYVAVINLTDPKPDVRDAQFLFDLKTVDRGWKRDCQYEDVVQAAREKVALTGANFMVITARRLPESERSTCNRIDAKLYYMPTLAGQEARIFWDTARTLQIPDLRGKSKERFPKTNCSIKTRLLGNFVSNMTVRTITTFNADALGVAENANPKQALRAAALQFDLAEIASRGIKQQLDAMSPDVNGITKSYKDLEKKALSEWNDRCDQLLKDLNSMPDPESVLSEWEYTIRMELTALSAYQGDYSISLRKK